MDQLSEKHEEQAQEEEQAGEQSPLVFGKETPWKGLWLGVLCWRTQMLT